MDKTLNQQVFELRDEGVPPYKIARQLKVTTQEVKDILGAAAEPAGLGDIVESVTEATGIKAAVEAVAELAGKDCGCAARKEKLNKIFPNRKLNDLSFEHHKYLTQFFKKSTNQVDRLTQLKLIEVYNDVFNSKREYSTCGSCVATMIRELKQVLDRANSYE